MISMVAHLTRCCRSLWMSSHVTAGKTSTFNVSKSIAKPSWTAHSDNSAPFCVSVWCACTQSESVLSISSSSSCSHSGCSAVHSGPSGLLLFGCTLHLMGFCGAGQSDPRSVITPENCGPHHQDNNNQITSAVTFPPSAPDYGQKQIIIIIKKRRRLVGIWLGPKLFQSTSSISSLLRLEQFFFFSSPFPNLSWFSLFLWKVASKRNNFFKTLADNRKIRGGSRIWGR